MHGTVRVSDRRGNGMKLSAKHKERLDGGGFLPQATGPIRQMREIAVLFTIHNGRRSYGAANDRLR